MEYLEKNETGDPSTVAWTECGELDHYGHQEGAKMALRIALVATPVFLFMTEESWKI